MKKLLSLMLVLSMMLCIVPALGESDSGAALPAPGEVVNGFEVLEVRDFGLIGATLVPRCPALPMRIPSIALYFLALICYH